MAVRSRSANPTEIDLEATAELPAIDFASGEFATAEFASATAEFKRPQGLVDEGTSATDVFQAPTAAVPAGLAELAESLREVENRLQRKMERVTALQSELADARATEQQLRAQIAREQNDARSRESALAEQTSATAQSLEAVKGDLTTRETALASARSDIESLRTQLATTRAELERRTSEQRHNEQDLQEMRRRSERQLEALRNVQGFRAVSDAQISERDDALEAVGGEHARQLGELMARHSVTQAELAALRQESAQRIAKLEENLQKSERAQQAQVEALRIGGEHSGLLTTQLADLKASTSKQLADLTASTAAQLNEIKTTSAAQLADLRKSSATELADFKKSSAAELAETKATSAAQLSELKTTSATQLSELKTTSEAQLSELKTTSEARLSELKATHAAQLAELKATHAAQIAALEATGATQLADLKTSSAAELAELKVSSAAQIAALEATNAAQIAERDTSIAAQLAELTTLRAQEEKASAGAAAFDDQVQRIGQLTAELAAASGQAKLFESDLHVAEERIAHLESDAHANSTLLGNLQQNIQRLGREDTGSRPSLKVVDSETATRVLLRQENGTDVIHQLGRRTSIGRTADNDIYIDATWISRHHAVVLANSENCVIEDLNSTNGVLVNGRRVGRHLLHDGDVITIGKTEFRYQHRP